MPRYRFGDFVLSPRRRLLVRSGQELPLIPRYFDLLVFLIEHRDEAVHRRDIFDGVWSDVVVSDSALSQAIRTIRRTLGDHSREPSFIRTVSRHGYRFVFAPVIEEEDEGAWSAADGTDQSPTAVSTDAAFETLLSLLTDRSTGAALPLEDELDAAEQLHGLGTDEALRRLGTRPGHARARAMLRASRWNVPEAGAVPLAGQPGFVRAAAALAHVRLRRAAGLVTKRWAAASLGAAGAGMLAGGLGGLLLAAAPDSSATTAVVVVLAVIGGGAGAVGGAGVGAGIAMSEVATRSRRTAALTLASAAGGGTVGLVVQWLSRWSLAVLVGVNTNVGGALQGLAVGSGAGFGYALATRTAEGMAAPRGRRRLKVAASTAATCGLAAFALTLLGVPLVGGTIHEIAQASQGSQAFLTPLGRLLGEPDFGPVSRTVIGTGEGALFGFGIALGLTRRP